MTALELGAVREVWFATLDAPTTKYSFLIRDDAYSKGEAVFGRTIRLGDPVDLGPNGTWKQTTWEGGKDQEVWNDTAMVERLMADGATKRGKLRLWPGWKKAVHSDSRTITRYVLCSGGGTLTGGTDYLYIGEGNHFGNRAFQASSNFYKYTPAGVLTTIKTDFTAPVNAIVRLHEPGTTETIMLIGLADGNIWRLNTNTDLFTNETSGKTIEQDSAVVFGDATYYGAGAKVFKRTNDGTTITHEVHKEIKNAYTIRGLAVWNSRLWFCALSGGLAQLWLSDGTTATPAINLPDGFQTRSMRSHWGALYIAGETARTDTAGNQRTVGQIWRYTGSSLTKLWEAPAGGWNSTAWALASWKQYLVWSKNGHTGEAAYDQRAGLMFYDAEVDAISEGPTLDMDPPSPEYLVCSLAVWNDTIVASFWDIDPYSSEATLDQPVMAAVLRADDLVRHDISGMAVAGRSFQNIQASRTDQVRSSRFDAGIPGEQKVWLTARLRVRIPAEGAKVSLYAILDENAGGRKLLGTVAYDAGNTGWRTVTLPVKDPATGKYLKSAVLQYELALYNDDYLVANSTSQVEVDSVEVDFTPAPRKRRQWKVRTVCSDAQLRLSGAANPLNTATAQRNKLEELWSNQDPLWFWDASATDTTSADTTTAVQVKLDNWLDQPYRLASDEATVPAEVSFSLTEQVQ